MSDEKNRPADPRVLSDHERPLGRILGDAHGGRYSPLRSLEEAKAVPDGVVILQGDDGGQIYVTCRAAAVACGADVLDGLLRDLDTIAWPGNDPDMRRVYFERLPVGSGIAGGMGGGRVTSEPWIHDEFVKLRLGNAIIEVLRGLRTTLR